MKFRMVGVTVAAVALVLTACAEEVASPSADDAERSALVQRTLDLRASVQAEGRISPEHRRDLDNLRARIVAWQARTGRSDLSVSAPRPATDSTPVSALVVGSPGGCTSCPGVKAHDGYICFLESQSPCTPKDFITQSCSYVCMYVGPPRRI